MQPKWIVRHVAVVLLVVAMVLLGFWQLRRLDEKRDLKATVEARQEEPAADVLDVVPADAEVGGADVEAVEHRSVTPEAPTPTTTPSWSRTARSTVRPADGCSRPSCSTTGRRSW